MLYNAAGIIQDSECVCIGRENEASILFDKWISTSYIHTNRMYIVMFVTSGLLLEIYFMILFGRKILANEGLLTRFTRPTNLCDIQSRKEGN